MQHVIVSGYQFQLGHQVMPGLVTVARFDGKHPSLACATTGGRVLIHSPHEEASVPGAESGVRFLNINKNITAIAAGPLVPGKSHDILFVGTGTSLMAYDVERNADVFYKEVPDGVSSITFGTIKGVAGSNPLVIVGGHCSIQGFDFEGKEMFWTVAGETVGGLTFMDFSKLDDRSELLAGSDDFAIRAFREEEVIAEITEADKVLALASMGGKPGRFAYALQNGTVGVYNKSSRVWRVKSKHACVAMAAIDLNLDGVPEVVSGWNNGSVTVRHGETGEVVFKDSMGAGGVAGIVVSDYRLTGTPDVLVVSTAGEVRGYRAVPADSRESRQTAVEADQKIINELQQRKGDLLLELKSLEESLKQAKGGGQGGPGSVPLNTSVMAELAHDVAGGGCELTLSTKSDSAIIVNVAVFDWEGGVFNGECLVYSPAEPSSTCRVLLAPTKNTGGQLHVQVHVGGRGRASTGASAQLHVFEMKLAVPRFCMFAPTQSPDVVEPVSVVTFSIKEQLGRIVTWIESSFLVGRIADAVRQSSSMVFNWVCLRGSGKGEAPRYLSIQAKKKDGCQVQIRVDDMDLAGELVQDLCRYLGLDELESTATFPNEMDSLRSVLSKVSDFNAQRVRLTADMADVSQRVKTLIVKAEDARILGDMGTMTRNYAELFKLNNQLIGEYVKRSNNHQALLDALKEVNHTIQKAANLRMGSAKTKVVNDCRAAIKANNTQALFPIISSGSNLRPGVGPK